MTGVEYINATNITKIRIAKKVLADVLEMDTVERGLVLAAYEALQTYEAKLNKLVVTTVETI